MGVSMTRAQVRYTVLSACAWRIASEVMRRYQAQASLSVIQFYPGVSPHGILRVAAPAGPGVDFGLGGGTNGSIEVEGARIGSVLELIEGVPSAQLVDRIAEAAGWRSKASNAPTNPPVLVARAIARVLERYMLAPNGYRTTSGFFDNAQESEVAGWLEALPEVWARMKDDPFGNDAATRRLASSHWLLHRCDDGANPRIQAVAPGDGPAIVFDVQTAKATVVGSPVRGRDLFESYVVSGHRLRAVVAWIEEALGAA